MTLPLGGTERAPVVLAAASAVAAAMHESVWPRLVAQWVGNSAWATGIALALFMAGLGLGALLPVWRAGWLARPRRSYALAEVVVAMGALVATTLFTRLAPPSSRLGADLVLDLVAAPLVLAPAALAMGATFPLLVASLRARPRVVHGTYAAGLVGACLGALFTAGVIVPAHGTLVASGCAVALNLTCATFARTALPHDAVAEVTNVVAPPWRAAMWRFGAAGLFGLGAQVVWCRALVPYAGVSLFAFAAIVAVYVGAQACGVWLHGRGGEVLPHALAWAPPVAVVSLALCGTVSSWPGARDGASLRWAAGTLAAVFVVVAPSAVLLGIAQAHALAPLDGVPGRASAIARATGFGTLLSALGSLAALCLIPWLGVRGSLTALACGFVVALPWRVAAASLVASAVLAVVAPGPRWFLGSVFDEARVLAAHVGVQDTTAVVLHDQPVEPMIRRLVAAGVSYSGDSRFAQRYMRLLAHLPALAAHRRTRALVICIGTGTTLDALRAHAFSRIDAVDIDPSIRETLRHFAHVHHGAPDAPEVRLHITDGARFLRACAPRSYDVITLEPPPPRAPGGSSLYTEESYRLARAALAEGGVVAQWLPLHDMGAWEAACLVETFLRVFPRGAFYLAERNEAVLLSERRSLSTEMAPAVRADLVSVGFRNTDPLRETLFADASGLRAASVDARVVNDAWPGPELAPLSLQRPVVPLSAWASRVAERTIAAPGSFAATMAPALAPFLRVLEGSAREGDRDEVSAVLRNMLLRDRDDVYLQYMHGYGPLLTERLDGLEREGADPRVIAVTRARIETLRARSLPR